MSPMPPMRPILRCVGGGSLAGWLSIRWRRHGTRLLGHAIQLRGLLERECRTPVGEPRLRGRWPASRRLPAPPPRLRRRPRHVPPAVACTVIPEAGVKRRLSGTQRRGRGRHRIRKTYGHFLLGPGSRSVSWLRPNPRLAGMPRALCDGAPGAHWPAAVALRSPLVKRPLLPSQIEAGAGGVAVFRSPHQDQRGRKCGSLLPWVRPPSRW